MNKVSKVKSVLIILTLLCIFYLLCVIAYQGPVLKWVGIFYVTKFLFNILLDILGVSTINILKKNDEED